MLSSRMIGFLSVGALSVLLSLSSARAASDVVSINSGADYTKTRNVTLAITAADKNNVARMCVSNSDATPCTPFTAFSAKKQWQLTPGNGLKTVHVWLKDKQGVESGAFSDSITLDATVPVGTKLTINNGAAYATSRTVALALAAGDEGSGVTEMQVSENNGFPKATWESYATSKSWTLGKGDGKKTVYARFRDAAGNISKALSATIILDTTPPKLTVNPTTTRPSRESSRTIKGTKEAAYSLTINPPQGVTAAPPTIPAGAAAWSCTLGNLAEGTNTVRLTTSPDAAGNVGTLDVPVIRDTINPTGTLTIQGTEPSNTYTSNRVVTLQLVDDGTGSETAAMRFSNDGKNWSGWEAFRHTKTWVLIAGSGEKTVNAQLRDAAGNTSAVFSDTIVLDTIPPAGSVTINGGQPYTNDPSVSLSVTYTDNVNSPPVLAMSDPTPSLLSVTYTDNFISTSQMQVSNTSSFAKAQWQPLGNVSSWEVVGADGVKTVYVRFRDQAGNISRTVTDTISLDTKPPALTISPDASGKTSLRSRKVSGTKEAWAEVGVTVNTSATVSMLPAPPAATTWSCIVESLVEGNNVVTVTATDRAMNETSATATIIYDPFGQAELAGTWHFFGGGDYYLSGEVVRGTVNIAQNGTVTGSYWRSLGGGSSSLGGSLELESHGDVTGDITLGNMFAGEIDGTMNPSRDLISLTGPTSAGEKQFILAVKEGSGFVPADLAGTWYLYGAVVENYSELFRGWVTLDANGKVVKGSITTMGYGYSLSVKGGSFTINGNGAIDGQLTINDSGDIFLVDITAGQMCQSKDTMAFTSYSYLGNRADEAFVAVKAGGPYRQADLTGTWAFHDITVDHRDIVQGSSAWGHVSVDSAGRIVGGEFSASIGSSILSGSIKGGTLKATSTGALSGSIQTSVPEVTMTVRSGIMAPSRKELTFIGRNARGIDAFVHGVKQE